MEVRKLSSREDLRNLLLDWQAGKLSDEEMYNCVSENHFGNYYDPLMMSLLRDLDMMDMNLITKDDVPIYLQLLDLEFIPEREERDEKWDILADFLDLYTGYYYRTLDRNKRAASLVGDPFYGKFARDWPSASD